MAVPIIRFGLRYCMQLRDFILIDVVIGTAGSSDCAEREICAFVRTITSALVKTRLATSGRFVKLARVGAYGSCH